jgi:hypothetical protein
VVAIRFGVSYAGAEQGAVGTRATRTRDILRSSVPLGYVSQHHSTVTLTMAGRQDIGNRDL